MSSAIFAASRSHTYDPKEIWPVLLLKLPSIFRLFKALLWLYPPKENVSVPVLFSLDNSTSPFIWTESGLYWPPIKYFPLYPPAPSRITDIFPFTISDEVEAVSAVLLYAPKLSWSKLPVIVSESISILPSKYKFIPVPSGHKVIFVWSKNTLSEAEGYSVASAND